jgi:hypothetical protein
MINTVRSFRFVVTLTLSIACAMLAAVWPGWLNTLRAQGYYYVPAVTNPINPGPINLRRMGGSARTPPCVGDFPGNVGGAPILADFEWEAFVPLAFVPGPNGATPTLLTDHRARSFVYTGVDSEGNGQLNLYLMYDVLHRVTPFGVGDNPTVTFDVAAGRFAGRMVAFLHCTENLVLVSGFDNGVPFAARDGSQLGIEGSCGFGKSPNPTGHSFFDVFVDPLDGITRGFNVPHAMFELEVPLTQNLGGGPRPGGGIYDPSPAFWSASAPGSGILTLSQNVVSIDVQTGSTTVSPESPSVNELSPAKVWIGLKNSDDVGLRLDLRAQVLLNSTKIGEGQVNNVSAGSSGFNNALLQTIPLVLTGTGGTVRVAPGTELQLTVSARRTCLGGGHSGGTARLWFNDSQANSRFDATIVTTNSDYFLRGNFALSTTAGSSRLAIDKVLNSSVPCTAIGGRPFTSFGTWTITLP